MTKASPTIAARRAVPPAARPGQEVQAFTAVVSVPIALAESVRRESITNLNQLLADSIVLRDLYQKHHWQTSGATFYPLHLLFDKHFTEQGELVDQIAERVMTLGGVCVAMPTDVAAMTIIPPPPRDREPAPIQLSRLLHAHEIVLQEARAMARKAAEVGDDGTNDLIVSGVIRTNEAQVWFVASHLAAEQAPWTRDDAAGRS
jgi:starvation-inducible DNA-binding protein